VSSYTITNVFFGTLIKSGNIWKMNIFLA